MKIIINLRKITDEKCSKVFEFTEFPVRIGREIDNEVILEDAKKIVSRSHAKIQYDGETFHLLDLGSANFTYLNAEKILPNMETEIENGDVINIGDYELNIKIEQSKATIPIDDQRTMVFSSPFNQEISKILEEILKLSEIYSLNDSPLKSELLRFSIMQNFDKIVASDVSQILSEYFADKFLNKRIVESNKNDSPSMDSSPSVKPKIKSELQSISRENVSNSAADYSFTKHFNESVDTLLDAVIKLIQGFLQFKQEFFGVTIYQTIPTGSLEEIKKYLFNQEISTDEQKKRVNLIKEETQKLLSHQIGLLKGYKVSVTEGSQSMLQSLDPEIIEKETASKQTSGLENFLPYLKKIKTLEAIKKSYKKYISDPYYLEKKFFRPAFIKGYQKPLSTKNEAAED